MKRAAAIARHSGSKVATGAGRSSRLIVGTDIGGTFTDIFLHDRSTGRSIASKVLTTPQAPEDGVIEGIGGALASSGEEFSRLSSVVHATTLATNALIERKGAVTGMLTTRGFRDVIEIGHEQMYDLYDILLDVPSPLVPRSLRCPVTERIGYDGKVLVALDRSDIETAVAHFLERGVSSVAVCFLHSYVNPEHERRAAAIVRDLAPQLAVSTSADILPEIGELGRFSTCVANAVIQPIVRRYVDRLGKALRTRGHRGSFLIVNSRGGTMTAEKTIEMPVRLLESGPAAGSHAAAVFARALKEPRVLSFDMGGTTAKICLVRDGEPQRTVEFEAARLARFKRKSGIPIRIPVVELIEIGAGGGSIARIDGLGLLAVGPESTGAEPGPACYGRGGRQPTVTDANLVLGFLNPSYFAGGSVALDEQAARAALVSSIGKSLRLSAEQAAWQVYSAVNDQMARAAAVHASEHGIDLRDFALFAFGGAGPAHAAAVARALGIGRVIVPPTAGVLSAVGAVIAPLAFDFAASYKAALAKLDVARANALLAAMEAEGRQLLARSGARKRLEIRRWIDMRYVNQRYEVTVALPWPRLTEARLPLLEAAFRDAYAARYGREIAGVGAEAVTWRVDVVGPSPDPSRLLAGLRPQPDATLKPGKRSIVWDRRALAATTWRRDGLKPGARIKGPAVVEDAGSTCVVPPGAAATLDRLGNLVMRL
ncbi:MAG: hydantoinase/oxoprolinase family protein [Alphaproteobacteria bacterium]|nr:hydantoinase/oxoprolinase family protein [Alphaproteobacteria bacterium]